MKRTMTANIGTIQVVTATVGLLLSVEFAVCCHSLSPTTIIATTTTTKRMTASTTGKPTTATTTSTTVATTTSDNNQLLSTTTADGVAKSQTTPKTWTPSTSASTIQTQSTLVTSSTSATSATTTRSTSTPSTTSSTSSQTASTSSATASSTTASSTTTSSTTTSSTTTSSTTTSTRTSPAMACGVNKFNNAPQGAGIVGGREAVVDELPWQARIGHSTGSCGAVLIDPNYVLTAAHCCPAPPTDPTQAIDPIFVLLGTNNINGPFEYFQLSYNYTRHPGYNALTLENDFCMITAPIPITYSDSIRPICLASDSSAAQECQPNEMSTSSGWGIDAPRPAGVIPILLKTTTLQVLSRNACQISIYPSQICAGNVIGQGTCQGDSGGPMSCLKNGRHVLSGLSSYVIICGEFPSGFARISSAYSWIKSYAPGV